MSPFGIFTPRRRFHFYFPIISFVELDLKPQGDPIGFLIQMGIDREAFSNIVNLIIGCCMQVELNKFGDITDNKSGINYPDHRLLRNPAFH